MSQTIDQVEVVGPQPLPAEALLVEPVTVDGETAIVLDTVPFETIYVASATEEDRWQVVEFLAKTWHCTCASYAFRNGRCRHLKIAQEAVRLAHLGPHVPCPKCGKPGRSKLIEQYRKCAVCLRGSID